MTKSTGIMIISFICTSLALTIPAEAAKKKPNPNAAIRVISVVPNTATNTPKSHVKHKKMVSSMKATLKRGQKTLKSARKDLSAVVKSENRNRKDRLKAKKNKDNALFAMRANNTPKNQAAYNRAYQAYLPVSERHESAIKAVSAQHAKVNKLEGFQRQAMNALRSAKRPQARRGVPAAINRSPQFIRPLSAYNKVPPASFLPSPPTNQPGRYQGQLSGLAQALNNNHYAPISDSGTRQNTARNQAGGQYIPIPTAPAFNY